jgi:peptide-methionine (R)-S-oxide reductase
MNDSHRMGRRRLLAASGAFLAAFGASRASRAGATEARPPAIMHDDAEWRRRLNKDQYAVLRRHATEPPFSSPLDHEGRSGTYRCAGCDRALFASTTKFESGSGWPSFYAPLANAVDTTRDTSMWMVRTEVHCSACGGHLGHVFDDGPKPTGLRYCINGVALKFQPGDS